MPVYDISYERIHGARRPRWARSWALGRSALGLLLKERRFLFLLALGWLPAIIRGGQIYVANQFPQVTLFEVTPTLWRNFLTQQVAFGPVLLVALYAGSGAIASDLRHGSIAIYLSKPLSRTDYLAGKAASVVLALLAITLMPALALLVFQVSLTGRLDLLRESPWLPISMAAYSAWLALYFSLLVLAVSSLTRSSRLAGAGFVLLAMGTHFLGGVAGRLSLSDLPAWVSLLGAAVESAGVFLGPVGPESTLCLVYMGFLMAAGWLLIDRRLRSAEVDS